MTYDPSLRVLTVLELLQAREEITGAELARRLEVSPRTVQRYVMKLQDLGIPVEGKRGVGGAYRLKPGFRLPPLMFTPDEALSLTLGLHALRLVGLSELTPAAQSASAKLARTLPQNLRAEVTALEQVVQLDASPWVVNTNAGKLTVLMQAVREARVICMEYRSGKAEQSQRNVQVYRVVHFDGRWYAVGLCLKRGALRSFRVDRIHTVTLLDDVFDLPEFDALAYLRSTHPTPRSYLVDVWLDAPPETLRGLVSMWMSDITAEAGGTRLRGQREQLLSFASFLLSLNVDFRIDSPPELHATFHELARRCQTITSGSEN
ncbi:helix-turn-helix transcriptional regulator [Deinococcus fonticola]|uniref:helix-turn-helix transcriptional regulator n=1 Tax=Deinococcus fonticola TaxID=2528713 RepID=UPI001074A673|nr:YafY family protein [Deinococcus fonticola]